MPHFHPRNAHCEFLKAADQRITPLSLPTPIEDVSKRESISKGFTILKNVSTVYNGDLSTACNVQVLEPLARVDDDKDAIR